MKAFAYFYLTQALVGASVGFTVPWLQHWGVI